LSTNVFHIKTNIHTSPKVQMINTQQQQILKKYSKGTILSTRTHIYRTPLHGFTNTTQDRRYVLHKIYNERNNRKSTDCLVEVVKYQQTIWNLSILPLIMPLFSLLLDQN